MGTYGVDALGALGDPTRRAIFELLTTGPHAVGELAARLPVSRPAVSQHLKVLKDAGLVVDEPDGTRRRYRIDPAGIAGVRDYLDRMWDRALAAFAAVAEQAEIDAPSIDAARIDAPSEETETAETSGPAQDVQEER